jgi:hypothetical protein
MPHLSPVVLFTIMMGTMLVVGCSTIPEVPSRTPSQRDPIVGLWISNQSGSTTFYRFHENGTFGAWSHTGDIHPKYSFQYDGKWAAQGSNTYITEGAHIGYGDVTALAIWRQLILVYDPYHDTFSIRVHPGPVFTRISNDPDSNVL